VRVSGCVVVHAFDISKNKAIVEANPVDVRYYSNINHNVSYSNINKEVFCVADDGNY